MTESGTRNAAAARDESVARIGRITRWIGTAAAAGALIAAAGFAHLIPTRLPQLNLGGAGNGSGGSSSSNGSLPQTTSPSGGLQGPATNPGSGGTAPSHVTSGGS
jgi:hypothetical protein